MAAVPDNTSVPQAASAQAEGTAQFSSPAPEIEPVGAADYPSDLLQNYRQLCERFRRTTNALASAAHDLKTPLAILNGYVELLQSEKLGPLNQRQKDVIGDMHANGQRLLHFIQDFLSYTVLETGELRVQYELGDANACLSEVCRLWSNRFQEKGQALYFLTNEKLTRFPFDSAKIQRVISNLLENASKFTPSGGTVWLHAEPYMWERRTASQPGMDKERRRQPLTTPNAVKVSVADTGPGIPPEYHLEVFDDFFRLPGNESQSDGMGLGLAIARRLVNAMGGKLWVESEPGAGSKFSFLVPLMPSLNSSAKGKSK